MKEGGILMIGDNVRAIIDDRKTQTRRVIKPQPTVFDNADYPDIAAMKDPKRHWQAGDRLYVREAYCHGIEWDDEKPIEVDPLCGGNDIWYFADGPRPTDGWGKYRHPRYMPKWASRLWLEITDNRVERVQGINDADAIAEGCYQVQYKGAIGFTGMKQTGQTGIYRTPTAAFHSLWDSINAKPKPQYKTIDGKKEITHYVSYPWEDIYETREYREKLWHVYGNPWVWAITSKRIE